jgi:hypothetical protein
MASHICDSLQYILMHFASDRIIDKKTEKTNADDWFNPQFRWQ